MATIYVIRGSAGEYSDRHEWLVEAHSTEVAAQARIRRLDELLQELGANIPHQGWQKEKVAIDAIKAHPEGDPHFSPDYTGTSYSYAECELVSQ